MIEKHFLKGSFSVFVVNNLEFIHQLEYRCMRTTQDAMARRLVQTFTIQHNTTNCALACPALVQPALVESR